MNMVERLTSTADAAKKTFHPLVIPGSFRHTDAIATERATWRDGHTPVLVSTR